MRQGEEIRAHAPLHPAPPRPPQTPDIHAAVSKGAFARRVSSWRARLHFWDASPGGAAGTGGAAAEAASPAPAVDRAA